MFKNNIHAFILSSSLPAFLLTMMYIGYFYIKNDKPKDIPLEFFSIAIPLSFGLFGMINYNITKFGSYNSLILGALFGCMLSLVGRYYYNIPEKLFKMSKETQKLVHFYGPVLYAIIFYVIISPLQDILIPN